MNITRAFDQFAVAVTSFCSGPVAFGLALGLVLGWASAGPYYGWSEFHSLLINTSTTIITFLMAFLILGSARREGAATQAKLDELIHATREARNDLVGIETKTAEDLEALRLKA